MYIHNYQLDNNYTDCIGRVVTAASVDKFPSSLFILMLQVRGRERENGDTKKQQEYSLMKQLCHITTETNAIDSEAI